MSSRRGGNRASAFDERDIIREANVFRWVTRRKDEYIIDGNADTLERTRRTLNSEEAETG